MIKLIFSDGTYQFLILDWKSGNNIYDTSYIQVATYVKLVGKQHKIDDLGGYIIQINQSLNKKGYRVYNVPNVEEEFGIFRATQQLYRRAFGDPKPKYRAYPTEVNLEFIKNNQIIKEQ